MRRLVRPLALFVIGLIGCDKQSSPVIDVPVVSTAAVPQRIEYSDWSLTLSRGVRGNEVDLYKLCFDSTPLDSFLRQAAAIGPKRTPALFPDDATRLAFLVNLHNAAVLSALTRHADPKRFSGEATCVFDGRAWTTADLRREIRSLSNDDWRVPFALYDGRRDGPPLWPKPILPDALDDQWTRIAQSAITQPQIVSIDHELQRLRLWPGLYENRNRLIAQYEQRYHTTHATVLSALLDLSDVDRRAELNTAIGYTVGTLPPNPAPAVVQHGTVLK